MRFCVGAGLEILLAFEFDCFIVLSKRILFQTYRVQLVHRCYGHRFSTVRIAFLVGLVKTVRHLAGVNTKRCQRVRAAGAARIRRRCADVQRAAHAGQDRQCECKADTAFEFHGLFLLFPLRAGAEKGENPLTAQSGYVYRILPLYHSTYHRMTGECLTKCGNFDMKCTFIYTGWKRLCKTCGAAKKSVHNTQGLSTGCG